MNEVHRERVGSNETPKPQRWVTALVLFSLLAGACGDSKPDHGGKHPVDVAVVVSCGDDSTPDSLDPTIISIEGDTTTATLSCAGGEDIRVGCVGVENAMEPYFSDEDCKLFYADADEPSSVVEFSASTAKTDPIQPLVIYNPDGSMSVVVFPTQDSNQDKQ